MQATARFIVYWYDGPVVREASQGMAEVPDTYLHVELATDIEAAQKTAEEAKPKAYRGAVYILDAKVKKHIRD
ncbi:MAG: hypothetical protein ACK4ZN_05010 [Oceanibaculum sp.]